VPNRGRRGTDVLGLRFPIQVVILIVTTSVTAAVTIWSSQYWLRSEVRDILTRMEMQVRVEDAQRKLQEERAMALKAAVDAMHKELRMTQYDVQGLKETVLKLQATKGQEP
jgi:hypothetical protein